MSSGELLSNGTTVLITRTSAPGSPTSPTLPGTPSPALDLFPLRRGATQDGQRGMKTAKNAERSIGARTPPHPKPTDKGKEPIRGGHTDTVSNFGRETYVSAYSGTSPYSSHGKTRPSTADGTLNGRSKFRGSLLVAASDALGFKFGRRRPQSVRQPSSPIILPDVIEISARRDEEDEERNHLRQMAAQAIGLGPFLVSPDSQSREDSTTDEDDDGQPPASELRLGYPSKSESVQNIEARSPEGSSLSVGLISQQSPQGGRYRSGSVAHARSNSMTIAPIPPYPSTVSALMSFKQCNGVFPKYYPPSSLRIFALSKNWKSRYLILSTPATLVTRGQGPAVSYLHLFKTSGLEEKELERLEINEDSVVFVSEEEVGGKRHVIKVGGADVGAMKKEYTHEEGGHTMWLLQIPDQVEAQKWITDIKNAILGQRTVRAGLIPAHTLGHNEPRGDMDVMLTIRAQNLITSPNPNTRSPPPITPINTSFTESKGTYASSISSHSLRSQTTVPKTPTTGAVSTLKGLFSNSRPRSTSRAASIESERQAEREGYEESFTSMGSNLLNMLRSNTPDTQSINTTISTPITRLPFSGPVSPLDRRIDRKILSEHPPIQWASVEPNPSSSVPVNRTTRGFSVGAMSLQPPPRKRWTSTTSSIANQDATAEAIGNDRSRRTSLTQSVMSTERAETEPPSSPGHLSAFQIGTPEQRPRAPSLQSVSTYASADNAMSMEQSSLSTKRSSGARSARRWSRQGVLPTRLTPPSDPPPAIPIVSIPSVTPSSTSERANTPSSAQSSDKSVVSNLPTFNKRASGSSVRSFVSYKTSHSTPSSTTANSNFNLGTITARGASHRASMPPPRPAPTSALPPAPIPVEPSQDILKPLENVAISSKSSFRNSVAHRGFRLSTIAAPKPPPSTTLPPRPDEPEFQSRRRSSSGGSSINVIHTHSPQLETIPASPIPPAKLINPFPPPNGPLPPTPPIPPSSHNTPQAIVTTKRATSIKERLRKISAPSGSGNQQQAARAQFTRPPSVSISAGSPIVSTSPPPTPIGEKITMFQNDPSFLQMHTPTIPPFIPQALLSLPVEDEEIAEVTSLSPPPRRGSKQLLETEMESFKISVPSAGEIQNDLPSTDAPRHLSLSRPGSIISTRSRLSQEAIDADWESPREEISPEQPPFQERLPSPIESCQISLSRPGSMISLGR
ncbi:hypothetical protein JR316_0007105 [Psilocybe cubensis]|uniref:Uncharacterized protein n=2 Tax=Psilocybe cubensis TaxID=181762 RepID=A0ACB8GXM8_PSICU|nr:hypothetical protein JR316_0007105 [Psilocybe cubensis]KAH9480505.1 hypothetical protein JR316_0007105 [Psilocybe cubensis]